MRPPARGSSSLPFRSLRQRLPPLIRGEDKPADNAERLSVAHIFYDQKQFNVATRLWTEALGSEPKLGDDRQAQHPYNAARAAALAATGQGENSAKLDDAAKAKPRQQALDWLEADLSVWAKLFESRPPQRTGR